MLAETQLLAKRSRTKRTRTTNLTDFATVRTVPRDLRVRVLSPTRRQNPQPLGLRYQCPLNSDAQPYAIWKPDFRHTRALFPELIAHIGKHCGPSSFENDPPHLVKRVK
ncbi:hypothetical protein QZH41_013011 [Actinostola sp. cb2023]|nr:hypothetical protein QZH41_013011 [Actinostola sp. cb2023]